MNQHLDVFLSLSLNYMLANIKLPFVRPFNQLQQCWLLLRFWGWSSFFGHFYIPIWVSFVHSTKAKDFSSAISTTQSVNASNKSKDRIPFFHSQIFFILMHVLWFLGAKINQRCLILRSSFISSKLFFFQTLCQEKFFGVWFRRFFLSTNEFGSCLWFMSYGWCTSLPIYSLSWFDVNKHCIRFDLDLDFCEPFFPRKNFFSVKKEMIENPFSVF